MTTVPAHVAPGAATVGELPAWPLAVLVVGYPAWWALGLSGFAVAGSAVVMAALMAVRGHIRLPMGSAIYAVFLLFVLGASIELDTALRAAGFAVRYASYLGAAVVALYVYNARALLPDKLVFTYIAGYFAALCAGGWLGVLVPRGAVPTVVEQVLPQSLKDNDLIHALVHPAFAEVQHPFGSPVIARPSAPFAYTNSWGCNAAILLPLMLAAILAAESLRRRAILIALLVIAAVPAAETLNRGMFLAMAFAVVYGAAVYSWRRRVAAFAVVLAVALAAVGLAMATGVLGAIQTRLRYSHSNSGRAEVYREAWQGALNSPLFGHGAPRPSGVINISIGTQGQIWNVMYSYGFPALGCFVGFFGYVAVRTFRAPGHTGLWLHVMTLVVLVCCVFYDFDGPELCIAMVGIALALRARSTEQPDPVRRSAGRQPVDQLPDRVNGSGDVAGVDARS